MRNGIYLGICDVYLPLGLWDAGMVLVRYQCERMRGRARERAWCRQTADCGGHRRSTAAEIRHIAHQSACCISRTFHNSFWRTEVNQSVCWSTEQTDGIGHTDVVTTTASPG